MIMDEAQQIHLNTKLWRFTVKFDTDYGDKVYVTGDCESLGSWRPKNIIPLEYDKKTSLWFIYLHIPADRDVFYRYYTCSLDTSIHPPKTIIRKWESNLQARKVNADKVCNVCHDEYDVFGMFDNVQKLENGWLVDDVAVQLRLNSTSIQWISNDCIERKTFINLQRSHQGHCNNQFSLDKNANEILISLRSEDGKFREQDKNGYSFNDTQAAVFMTRTFSLDNQGFVFKFIVMIEAESPRYCYSHLMLDNKFHGSTGYVKVPIYSPEHEYLGSLNVKYLIVRPLPSVDCLFKSSYAKYWNNSWTGLEIGHRGTGVSFGNSVEKNAKWRENTIGSFKSAGQHGAHLVEFDVQLTNDLVPTIYHDFHVLLDVQNKIEGVKRKMIFPFHKLTYEELKGFKIHHLKETNGTYSFENDDQEDFSPFPSLEAVLRSIDFQIGFNIEIKYTSQLQDGSEEVEHPIDMNEYMDKILQVVYENAGRRYIVFSSFSPEICIMARFKQNKFPVMFLTQGKTKKYPPYSDDRMKTIQSAINFANSADLLGIVAHSEDLLDDYSLVKMILNSNLVLFCWGEQNNNHENIEVLKKQGVHGIIFDRIDQLGQKLKNNFGSEIN